MKCYFIDTAIVNTIIWLNETNTAILNTIILLRQNCNCILLFKFKINRLKLMLKENQQFECNWCALNLTSLFVTIFGKHGDRELIGDKSCWINLIGLLHTRQGWWSWQYQTTLSFFLSLSLCLSTYLNIFISP